MRTAQGEWTTQVVIAAVAPGIFTANADGQGVPAALAIRVDANGGRTPVAVFDSETSPVRAAPIDLGRGFASFESDSKNDTLNAEAKNACFQCHVPRKDQDYVFSVYRER